MVSRLVKRVRQSRAVPQSAESLLHSEMLCSKTETTCIPEMAQIFLIYVVVGERHLRKARLASAV